MAATHQPLIQRQKSPPQSPAAAELVGEACRADPEL